MGRSGMETRAQPRAGEGTQAQPATASIHVLRGRGALARRRNRELASLAGRETWQVCAPEIVEYDATRTPQGVPPYLWKWQAHAQTHEIPSYGEPGVAYWIEHEQRAYLWVGALQIMPVKVQPPADIGGDEMLPFEDQLDRDERIRCEALGLAIAFAQTQGTQPPRRKATDTIADLAGELHELAAEFVKYIENGLPEAVDDEDEEEAAE